MAEVGHSGSLRPGSTEVASLGLPYQRFLAWSFSSRNYCFWPVQWSLLAQACSCKCSWLMAVPVQVVGLVPCGLLTCTSYSRGCWLRFVPTEFTGSDLLTLRWFSWTGSFKVYWLWPPIVDVADLGLKILFFNGQGTLSVESVFTSFFTHFLSRVSNYLEPVRKFIGIEFIF